MKVYVVIPTYNEAKAIAGILKRVKAQRVEAAVVIDDGSSDNTAQIAKDSGAIVLANKQNAGKGASLLKGFDYLLTHGFDAVITMDGDGQHLPEDIPLFLNYKLPSAIIVGNRMSQTKNMPAIRIITNKFMSWMISGICKQKIPDTQCGFRLIRREVLEKIHLESYKYEIESELLIKAARSGFKINSVDIGTVYAGEKSQINPFVDSLRFIRYMIKELWTRKA